MTNTFLRLHLLHFFMIKQHNNPLNFFIMKNQHKNQRAHAPEIHGVNGHEILPNESTTNQACWLDSTEISQLFHTCKRTLARYHRKGMIAASKLGGRVYYRPSDLYNYLTTHMVWKHPES